MNSLGFDWRELWSLGLSYELQVFISIPLANEIEIENGNEFETKEPSDSLRSFVPIGHVLSQLLCATISMDFSVERPPPIYSIHCKNKQSTSIRDTKVVSNNSI